jgi:sulfur-carrier protein adenylyltransferase/sulfurtransferase
MLSLFRTRPIVEIDPPALPAMAGARLIDVREPHELEGELGHLPGVENVPLATIAAAAARWRRDQPILVICRSGGRSGRAAETLVGMGFTRVTNLRGGMLAVNAAGLPVVRGGAR